MPNKLVMNITWFVTAWKGPHKLCGWMGNHKMHFSVHLHEKDQQITTRITGCKKDHLMQEAACFYEKSRSRLLGLAT